MASEPLSLYRALVIKADQDGYWEGTRDKMALVCNFPREEVDSALVHLWEWRKVIPIGTSLFGDATEKWWVQR